MSEQTSKAGTSGQKVPKSKFRPKSQQEQTAESKLRMEKRGERLENAKEKLAKQKPPKKPGPAKKAGRAVGGGVHGFVHGKLYEVEHENVGTEGAHRSELVGESALRHGSQYVKRQMRQHPAKAVQKAESRYIKATADYYYRKTVEEHPEMRGSALYRYMQKQKIKRQYAKQAREAAKQGAKAAERTAVTTEKLAARTVAFVKRHPVGVLLFLACFLLLVMMQSCMSSLVTLGNGAAGPSVRLPTQPRTPICWAPKPPIVPWRTSCGIIWTPIPVPTTMTSIISTSMTLNTIPMYCSPL